MSHDVQPRIWLLQGDKLGDNAQLGIIAEALGLPYEKKTLVPLARYRTGKPRFRPTLAHLDLERSDPLRPPWPDLILTVGRRPLMAALWVRKRSEGRSKIVVLGRPRRSMEDYALVIAPPQYLVPRHDRVLSIRTPLIQVDYQRLKDEHEKWRDKFAELRSPLFVLLIGGPTHPYRLEVRDVELLISNVQKEVRCCNGSLYVVTSRRTPKVVAQYLESALSGEVRFYRWGRESENPYHALLLHGDRFIVTCDSISMITEVVRLGKPLSIYPLPTHAWARTWNGMIQRLYRREGMGNDPLMMRLARKFLCRTGLAGYPRDLSRFHRWLITRGHARWWGDGFSSVQDSLPDESSLVAERIRSLLQDRASGREG